MAVTTSYYTDTWHGSFDGSQEDLTILLDRAAGVINNSIYLSGYTVDTVPEAFSDRVSKAICAQADYIDNLGGKETMSISDSGSMSLGKFSYSGGNTAAKSSDICSQARSYLIPTGLLYRGVTVI